MEAYFDLIDRGYDAWTVGGDARTLTIAARATDAEYGRMNPMRNYVYGRVNQPDALGVLYLKRRETFVMRSRGVLTHMASRSVYVSRSSVLALQRDSPVQCLPSNGLQNVATAI